MLFRYFLAICFLIPNLSRGDDHEGDTIQLDPLTITGNYYHKFSAGSRIIDVNPGLENSGPLDNLDGLIRSSAPVYFKSYGAGMLSSISFRGTGASHTSVLWNGINLNQPTLGQTDFSLFPQGIFDRVEIHYGASSARYGSESIGGSIHLRSKPGAGSGLRGMVSQSLGSYGLSGSSGEFKYGLSDKIQLTTRAYFKKIDNDFTYVNFTKPGRPVEAQQNAAIQQAGAMQDVFIQTSRTSDLSVYTWYNWARRQIQPTMNNPDAREIQEDASIRLLAEFNQHTSFGNFQYSMGFLADRMIYNRVSETSSNQYINQVNYDQSWKDLEFRLGIKYNYIKSVSENYMSSQGEGRTDVYGSLLFNGLTRTLISLNARQTFVEGYQAPFSPAIGVDFKIWQMGFLDIMVGSQASLNYRIPTMNERYWMPGGRIDIRPEQSINLEGRLLLSSNVIKALELSFSGFHYNVDDWILWVPGPSYWYPENIQEVHAYGYDISLVAKEDLGAIKLDVNAQYSFTRSIQQSSEGAYEGGFGKQLPYTPVHIGYAGAGIAFRRWASHFDTEFTGIRYVTADNETALPAFNLINWGINRKFMLGRQQLMLDFSINNLLNESYQNVQYRAMPGRNYQVTLKFLFTS